MKRITLILLTVAATLACSVSCQKDNVEPVEPTVPQGEVTRAFLSQIRVGKDGRFQYWNQDSPALKELKAFVTTVTDPNCKGYVPPQDRVATFDVDGTLLCETAPFYFNWMLFFHRYLHDSTFTPPEEDRLWAAEAEEYVLANRKNKKEWGLKQQELQAIGFRGMTDVQFSEYVSNFINNESTFYPSPCQGASNGFIIRNLIFEDINNSAYAFI